jgi:hypothetical protein
LGDFISHCLGFGHIDIVFGRFLLHIGDDTQFLFDCLSLLHFSHEVVAELVGHHHVHVIRWESSDTELDGFKVGSNVLRKRLGVFAVFSYLFGLS